MQNYKIQSNILISYNNFFVKDMLLLFPHFPFLLYICSVQPCPSFPPPPPLNLQYWMTNSDAASLVSIFSDRAVFFLFSIQNDQYGCTYVYIQYSYSSSEGGLRGFVVINCSFNGSLLKKTVILSLFHFSFSLSNVQS